MANNLVKVAIVLVTIIGILLGLLAYSYTQIHISLNDVSLHSIDWAQFSWSILLKLGLNVLTGNWLGAAFDLIQGINLDLAFGLSNGGILPVYIPNLSYDLAINGIPMGKGYSYIDTVINPGETKEITALQNFEKSSLAPAVSSIVGNGGVIKLHVSGTAYFKLLGFDIPISFESTKQISIKDEIKKRLNSEIQKNKQQSSNSIDSLGQSIGSALESIKNKITGTPNRPNLQLSGQTMVDSVYRVSPGGYYYIPLTLPCDARIQGGFSASAALGDNIIVYVFDESQFEQYQNGESTSTYYNSGKIESGTFDMYLDSGTYYLVLSNTYSTFSTKNVALQVAGQCN